MFPHTLLEDPDFPPSFVEPEDYSEVVYYNGDSVLYELVFSETATILDFISKYYPSTSYRFVE